MVKGRPACLPDATAGIPRVLACTNSRSSVSCTADITPTTTTSVTVVFGNRGLAALDSMSHVTTVAALDPGVVTRLGAIPREMTNQITVAALSLVGVFRLIAVLGNVLSRVAVTAGSRRNVRTILGEVTSLHAFTTLNTLGGTRLRAILGIVAILLAIPARMWV